MQKIVQVILKRESILRKDQESKDALTVYLLNSQNEFLTRDVYRMVRHHTEWGDLVPLIETVRQELFYLQ